MALAALAIVVAAPIAALTLRPEELPATTSGAVSSPGARLALAGPEPDRLADAFAPPESERLPHAPEPGSLSSAIARALSGPDDELARRLAAALEHEPEHAGDLVRERAAWALSLSMDGRLVEPLIDALEAPDWRARAYAAWALAGVAEARVVDRLIPLLDHPVWRVRAMAAYSLRASADPRAEGPMTDALDDVAWQVRVEAVEYLAALPGRAHEDALHARLEDRHVAVRHAPARHAAGRAVQPR